MILKTYRLDTPQKTFENFVTALMTKIPLSNIVGTIVIGPINFNTTPTNPVAPTRKCNTPTRIKQPSNYNSYKVIDKRRFKHFSFKFACTFVDSVLMTIVSDNSFPEQLEVKYSYLYFHGIGKGSVQVLKSGEKQTFDAK